MNAGLAACLSRAYQTLNFPRNEPRSMDARLFLVTILRKIKNLLSHLEWNNRCFFIGKREEMAGGRLGFRKINFTRIKIY